MTVRAVVGMAWEAHSVGDLREELLVLIRWDLCLPVVGGSFPWQPLGIAAL